jgi:hypothetical protein
MVRAAQIGQQQIGLISARGRPSARPACLSNRTVVTFASVDACHGPTSLQVELEAPRAPPGNRGFFFWPAAMLALRLLGSTGRA